MPDPTPAEEIRARYLDIIAMQQMGVDPARWRTASEPLRNAARGLAEDIVRALEAAGALPTGETFGVLDPDEDRPSMTWADRNHPPGFAEKHARDAVDRVDGRKLMRCYTHDWREVPNG